MLLKSVLEAMCADSAAKHVLHRNHTTVAAPVADAEERTEQWFDSADNGDFNLA
jgi:hypothetical protein